MGDLATISFHDSKNIHCGEGGVLLINNKKFIKRAKIIRDKGTNRDNFVKNIVLYSANLKLTSLAPFGASSSSIGPKVIR